MKQELSEIKGHTGTNTTTKGTSTLCSHNYTSHSVKNLAKEILGHTAEQTTLTNIYPTTFFTEIPNFFSKL